MGSILAGELKLMSKFNQSDLRVARLADLCASGAFNGANQLNKPNKINQPDKLNTLSSLSHGE
jgi:hypothetical protein